MNSYTARNDRTMDNVYSINTAGPNDDSDNDNDDDNDERTRLLAKPNSSVYTHSSGAVGNSDESGLTKDLQIREGTWLTSKRWQVSYLAFLGCYFLFALRVDLSVSIVCMCNETKTGSNSTTGSNHVGSEFTWSRSTTSNLLSAYFYGFLLLQMPGGWLAGRYGATRVIALAMACSALCTLAMPLAARNSLPTFYALRVATGLFSGCVSPSFQSLWGQWAPPQERARLVGFTFAGGFLGSTTTYCLSGFLCDRGFDGGWPSIFYIIGAGALLWTLVWYIVVYDSPSSHPTISRQEKEYITSSLQSITEKRQTRRVPWREIFTSAPCWSLIIASIGLAWVDYTFMTSAPQYLSDVLKFKILEGGVLTAIPPICQFVSSVLVGSVADYIGNRGVRTVTVRRLFQGLTFTGRAVCIVSVGYITQEHRYLAVALLGLAGFFAGLQQAGFVANCIDIAPRFAGEIYGLGVSIATLCGVVSPVVVGILTTGKSRAEWQIVFFICGGVSIAAAILYVCLAQGHVQSWAVEVTPEADHNGVERCPGDESLPAGDDETKGVRNKGGDTTRP